jgi:nucleoside-diphosphate-sugar epimerase
MLKILVTGASGFVGKRLVAYNKEIFTIETISLQNDHWKTKDFSDFDAVVHLAGKAHEMSKIEDHIYFDVNYALTKSFFEKITADGVSHFVYISSTKVYGDDVQQELKENSDCHPNDAYGESKWKAEQFLLQQTVATVAIVRPPLVYGPNVKGNMLKIMELCNSNKPLPFASIANKRSMVYVDNLIELINTILQKKAKGIFVAGDLAPISTTTLVTLIRNALGKKVNIFSIPQPLRTIIKRIKPSLYIRLFGSFYINNKQTNEQLNFIPKYTTQYGVEQMVNAFLNNK